MGSLSTLIHTHTPTALQRREVTISELNFKIKSLGGGVERPQAASTPLNRKTGQKQRGCFIVLSVSSDVEINGFDNRDS